MDRDGDELVCDRCGNRRPLEPPAEVRSFLDHQNATDADAKRRLYVAEARANVRAGAEKQIGRRYTRPRDETE
jgi:hypothetical protein